MFQSPPPAPDADEPPDTVQDRRNHELAMLAGLADAAMALAMAFQKKALAALEAAGDPEQHAAAVAYGRAFDHSARTVRQCLALRGRIADLDQAVRRKAAEAAEADEETVCVEIAARRTVAVKAVKVAIDAQKRPPAETERLFDQIDEILAPFDEMIFVTQPTGLIAQSLCAALDIPVDLSLWRDTVWAQEEILLRPRGSPFEHAPMAAEDPAAKPP